MLGNGICKPKCISSGREKSTSSSDNHISYFCLKTYAYTTLMSVVEMAWMPCSKSDLQEPGIAWLTTPVVHSDYGIGDYAGRSGVVRLKRPAEARP